MQLIVDTADIAQIKRINQIIKIDGVTTNPSIICKSKSEVKEVLQAIIEILSEQQKLFVQVVARDYDSMLEEARFINSLRPKNIYVKIPANKVGIKLIRQLSQEGIKTLATAIYSSEQGFLAARNGANYLAPYVNRMDNFGDGVSNVIDLQTMLNNYGMNKDCQLIAASFKNLSQVHRLLTAGVSGMTLPVEIIDTMIEHPATEKALDKFSQDWQDKYHRSTLI